MTDPAAAVVTSRLIQPCSGLHQIEEEGPFVYPDIKLTFLFSALLNPTITGRGGGL